MEEVIDFVLAPPTKINNSPAFNTYHHPRCVRGVCPALETTTLLVATVGVWAGLEFRKRANLYDAIIVDNFTSATYAIIRQSRARVLKCNFTICFISLAT